MSAAEIKVSPQRYGALSVGNASLYLYLLYIHGKCSLYPGCGCTGYIQRCEGKDAGQLVARYIQQNPGRTCGRQKEDTIHTNLYYGDICASCPPFCLPESLGFHVIQSILSDDLLVQRISLGTIPLISLVDNIAGADKLPNATTSSTLLIKPRSMYTLQCPSGCFTLSRKGKHKYMMTLSRAAHTPVARLRRFLRSTIGLRTPSIKRMHGNLQNRPSGPAERSG